MWWDSLNHKLDHKLVSITGMMARVGLFFWSLFCISSLFFPGSGPTEATHQLSGAFTETPLKLWTLQRGYNNGLDGSLTPGLKTWSSVSTFLGVLFNTYDCKYAYSALIVLKICLNKGFWCGNNELLRVKTRLTADRHQTAILSKNVPHLQQEGSHFWERWHQGSKSMW